MWLLWLLMELPVVVLAVMGKPPSTIFFDGNDSMNQCATRLHRKVTGGSGVIFSHSLYGRMPYNASRNCFVMIVGPIGYRIRLKALEFSVNGESGRCEKDTLHVFDNEASVDPLKTDVHAEVEFSAPAPIRGQYCGHVKNGSVLGISSHNAMTLWWHSNQNQSSYKQAGGFKLLWTAFRETSGSCSSKREFQCLDGDCIPIDLACDHMPDCKDGSDLLPRSRVIANCENMDLDMISTMSGSTILLLSAFIVITFICTCIGICLVCRKCKTANAPLKAAATTFSTPSKYGPSEASVRPPEPPTFYPPSPPKVPPPSIYTPRRSHGYDQNPPRSVRVFNEYTSNDNTNTHSDYAYVRNDVQSKLIL